MSYLGLGLADLLLLLIVTRTVSAITEVLVF